ncbi:urease accessory protein UreF [Clostridium sp. NSJ-6]|uniref:Urease accessory protein UreF n=2 Tax=Clostridium hominis TaxID=2763036 RepID=A0ABR7DHK2_9CLOT|nr:urease accessory protein UreF [Clostridium hominis]
MLILWSISISMDKSLKMLQILQLCDSNFPIGSFNHSYGMETYLRSNVIDDAKSFSKWVDLFLKHQFITSDGLAIRMLYEALENGDVDKVWEIDNLLIAQTVAKETRNAAKLVASRMIKIYLDLYEIENLKIYAKKIASKEVYGHPAIVFGLLMHELEMSEEEAIKLHMYSTVSTIIQNAVRAIPLGQKDGQLLVKEYSEKFNQYYKLIEELDFDSFGANTPGIELSQINHETLGFRLFMS